MAILDALWLPTMAIYAVVLLTFLSISLNLLYLLFVVRTRPPRHAEPPPLIEQPWVTVQLPIFNELYVTERLIRAACALDWRSDRLEIQVLDDSTDETRFVAARLVREYRAQGVNIEHVRRKDRVGFKAGALAAGLQSARGEFIAIFDADFVPPRDFLLRTIPYFHEARAGFVQTRWGHLNRSYSLLTELQSVIIDAHFLVDQVARNRGGYFMNFNGTAGIWRRETIVDAGGWHHDTLAEDLDLSYRAQLRGWHAVYLPELVTYAELPVTISAYRCQQRRWAAGGLACAIKLLPRVLKAPLPRGVKAQAAFHLLGYASHLCLLMGFVLQPFLLYYSSRFSLLPSTAGISPLWFAIFSLPAMAPGIYLGFAQWRAHGKLLPRIPYILGATVLGAGIMLTTVGAMARVLYTKKVVFERTPKYGIAAASDSWNGKRYGLALDPVLALELMLVCFSFGSVIYAATLSSWGTFFYTSYFLTGLLFVVGTSLAQMSVPGSPGVLASTSSGSPDP